MTENTSNPNADNATPSGDDPAYRAELLDRAQRMGISVHPNAKNETIAAKINAALKSDAKPGESQDTEKAEPNTDAAPAVKDDGSSTPPLMQDRIPSKQDKDLHPAKRLKRVIITCNDPQKADQTGDIISVSNSEVGNLRFYFHFNKPWHVPQIILDTIKESKLFLHSSRKDGREIVTREVPRYNIQELPALTDKERKRIEDKQAAALATEE